MREIETINICDKLSANKFLINFQSEEIKKSEESLVKLEQCLLSENNNLRRLHEEERRLKEEMKKRSEPRTKNYETEEQRRRTEEVEKVSCQIFEFLNSKSKINEKEKLNYLRKVEIPELKNRIIHKMIYKNGLIIGGSKGLLMKYNEEETFIYETNTDSDIVEIRTVTLKNIKFIISFTKQSIFTHLFNKSSPEHVLYVSYKGGSEIKNIYYEGWQIFFISNCTSTFDLNQWNIIPSNRSFINDLIKTVPRIECNNFSMFNVQDTLSHKISEVSFTELQIINIFKEIKSKYDPTFLSVCCSHNTVWIVNKECIITDKIRFEFKIKIMERYKIHIAVVDEVNNIFVYLINIKGKNKILYKLNLGVNVTSITITCDKIYVASDDDQVFIMKYNS